MKQKPRFVKAGATVVSVVYSPGFKELCKEFDIAPETAIECFISELGICSKHFSNRTNAQVTATMLFDAMIGIKGYLPDEPFSIKKKIATLYILMLVDAETRITDPRALTAERKRIINKWYLKYEKHCSCTENLK